MGYKDWYNRHGAGFTRLGRTKSRIGWESGIDQEDSYSSYFWKPRGNVELIKKAYSLAKDMIIVMNPPFKVNIQISTEDVSFTDGRKVCISSSVFDAEDYEEGEKVDIFCGTTVHEGCHLLFTEFGKFRDWVNEKEPGETLKAIFNILEDERIEEELADDKPGLISFIEKMKYYYYDYQYIQDKRKRGRTGKRTDMVSEAEELVELFLYLVRYPKYITKEMVEKHEDLLEKIRQTVTPMPKDTEATIKAAEEVFKLLVERFSELKDVEEKDGKTAEESKKSGKDGKSAISPKSEFERLTSSLTKCIKKLTGDPKYGFDMDSGYLTVGEGEISESLKRNELDVMDVEGRLETGTSKDTIFFKERSNKRRYEDAKKKIERYIPAIRKSIKTHSKNYELIHRGCRSGILDTNKLAEAYQGVPCVYIRKGEVKTEKVAVCVLVDESGSMGNGDREIKARQAAILLNESLKDLPGVSLFIYGHTGDEMERGKTEIRTYREGKAGEDKYALGSLTARCENRDGVAIYETAMRVRKMCPDRVLYFIISDGQPSACDYWGNEAVDHTRKMVKKTEGLGFDVVQVCIDTSSYNPEDMFDNYIIIKDISDLPIKLAKEIKKATIKAAKVSMS